MSSNTNNLEETARNFLIEQKMNSVAQWEKRKKPDIDSGSDKPSAASPNSLEEDSVEESTTGLGANHKPIKTKYKGTLGALEMRNWGGNQKRTPSTYNMSRKLSEAREKSFAKVSKKKEIEKQENNSNKNKTDTGQSPDFVDFRPNKNELTNN